MLTVIVFIEYKADINRYSLGTPPFSLAVEYYDIPILNLFVSYRAKINKIDKQGNMLFKRYIEKGFYFLAP